MYCHCTHPCLSFIPRCYPHPLLICIMLFYNLPSSICDVFNTLGCGTIYCSMFNPSGTTFLKKIGPPFSRNQKLLIYGSGFISASHFHNRMLTDLIWCKPRADNRRCREFESVVNSCPEDPVWIWSFDFYNRLTTSSFMILQLWGKEIRCLYLKSPPTVYVLHIWKMPKLNKIKDNLSSCFYSLKVWLIHLYNTSPMLLMHMILLPLHIMVLLHNFTQT